MFAMNLALVANNIGLMWVAIEMATLTTVLMVGIYRTHEALEAAWKYFILGSVGIALALFGTILVYMAARPVVGEGLDAMVWTVLVKRAGGFDPALLDLAFVFLLLGYGTKVGLAPLHAWLPDAHAEGPTPISAVLSGLLLNVALYALLRFKMLLAANAGALAPGPLMVTLGLISLVFAAFMLYRRRDIKRMFAYSSIEHMGIITFAFGMGGPIANFAGLLHMTMHSLTKSAIFFAVGHVAQVKGTQRIADMGGPHRDASGARLGPHPRRRGDRRTAAARHFHERISGGELDLRPRAAAGDHSRLRHSGRPRRAVPAAQQHRLRRAARAERQGAGVLRADVRASRAGASPPASTCRRRWSPGSRTSPDCSVRPDADAHSTSFRRASASTATGRGRASSSTPDAWRHVARELAAGRATLLGLWGDSGAADGAHGDHARRDRRDRGGQPRLSGRKISLGRRAASAGDPSRARDSQSLWADAGRRAGYAALARSRLLGRAASARRARQPAPAASDAYAFLPVEGESLHQIPVGPVHAGIIEPGHFRFTASGETVVRLEERLGYVHKGIESLMAGATHRASGAARRAHLRRQHRRLWHRLRARRRSGARHRGAAARAISARADGGAGAAGQSFRRYRRDLQRRLVRADACALRHPARARAARRRRLLRPSADDGSRRARRRRRRSRRRRR